MNIAFCSSEVYPFAKTGGLGDVCGSLPLVLEKLGLNVVVILPGYRGVSQSGVAIEPLTERVSRAVIGKNVRVYIIEHAGYFDRDGYYGDSAGDYTDNLDRFRYFSEQALDALCQVDFHPDVVHCHEWQTALIPVLLKLKYRDDPFFSRVKSLLTVHNMAFQGIFPQGDFGKLGLPDQEPVHKAFEFYGQINLLKAGIVHCDRVSTVSPKYASEIQTKEFGCGLEDVLRKKHQIAGIVNGIDYGLWDPAKDPYIARTFDQGNAALGKAHNKVQLQKKLLLEGRDDCPLFGFVGRLTHQKGMDLILASLKELLEFRAQYVFLGLGAEQYTAELKAMVARHPEKMAACFEFNEPLGHQIYAASDFFLMPSQFEPCGLSQMISLRYGAIPVVYKIGGLADTVRHYNFLHQDGNGFVFGNYDKAAFLRAVQKALAVYGDAESLRRLRQNAFASDFSWESSAKKYLELYRCV